MHIGGVTVLVPVPLQAQVCSTGDGHDHWPRRVAGLIV
jgi:hypothetical protein